MAVACRPTNDRDFRRLQHDRLFDFHLRGSCAKAHARIRRAPLRAQDSKRGWLASSEAEPTKRESQIAGIADLDSYERRRNPACRGRDLKAEAHGGAVAQVLGRERRRQPDRLARVRGARPADEHERQQARQLRALPPPQ